MNFNFILVALGLLLGQAAGLAAAQEGTLEEQLAALRAEVARLAAAADAARIAELERRIDLLAQELERARTGGAAQTEPARGTLGLGPAASKVYRRDRGVSLGGYGEAVYQGGDADQLDALRSVFYVGNKFSDRVLFNSEIEFEHATTGEGDEEKGEVSVEFAYLDFKPWQAVGIRAGQLLIPLGFLNELHEPPVFSGVRRTETERLLIPTTWRDVGAGVFGETGPFSWRGYLVASLDSAGFAAGGIREGRQGGSQSRAKDLAFTARADYGGSRLLAGMSVFSGEAGQGASVAGARLGARVTVFDLHAQYERRGLQLRGLYARSAIDDAALVNARNGLSGADSVGERQYGFYVQAAYDVLESRQSGWALVPFVRYEKLDTQSRVPAGFAASPANERRIWTAGVGVRPVFGVVLKGDYQWSKDGAGAGSSQLNLGIGYLF